MQHQKTEYGTTDDDVKVRVIYPKLRQESNFEIGYFAFAVWLLRRETQEQAH